MYNWTKNKFQPSSAPLQPFLVVLVALCLLLGGTCNRQLARRPAPESEPSRGKISLREVSGDEKMSELAQPQLEPEKQAGYTFNKVSKFFDLDLEGALLGPALQSMCDELGYNLVLDPAAADTLTLHLKNVTFTKFLDIALEKKNFEYRIEDNFVYVNAPRLETRIYNLNYLNAARQLLGTMTITGIAGAASGGLVTQSNTTLQTQSIANLWADIRNSLREIVLGTGLQATAVITPEGSFAMSDPLTHHRLVIEPNSGVVQITAPPEVLDRADKFITALESSLQRQVLIEARFVEINLSNTMSAGLDWSVVPDLTSVSNLSGALGGGAVATQALNPAAREVQMGISNQNINATLSAISKHGSVNVLQSPQVSTLNNQPAVIRVARTETFFQRQETPGQQATATSPATQPVVNYIPVQQPTGVVLNLTPQIGKDGLIIMSIRPSITSIAAVATSPDGLSTSPITDIRELDTVAKVRHGQTIILAGLIQERDLENVKETPVLSKLPLLGNLFKQVSKDRAKVELVILLTPFINYSRTAEEITAEQLPRYKEVAKRYEVKEGGFNK